MFRSILYGMEVEYSGGGVLILSYLILIHRLDTFGGLRVAEAAWYEWVHWLPLWWPTWKRRKPPMSATDGALGRHQSNSNSMLYGDQFIASWSSNSISCNEVIIAYVDIFRVHCWSQSWNLWNKKMKKNFDFSQPLYPIRDMSIYATKKYFIKFIFYLNTSFPNLRSFALSSIQCVVYDCLEKKN